MLMLPVVDEVPVHVQAYAGWARPFLYVNDGAWCMLQIPGDLPAEIDSQNAAGGTDSKSCHYSSEFCAQPPAGPASDRDSYSDA